MICTKGLNFLFDFTVAKIQSDYLINQRKLCILKLITDVLSDNVRILTDKLDI